MRGSAVGLTRAGIPDSERGENRERKGEVASDIMVGFVWSRW